MVDQVQSKVNIDIFMTKNTYGLKEQGGVLTALELQDTVTKEFSTLPVDGVFVCIGQEPQSEPFALMGITDDRGYYDCDETTLTTIPGLFVAGDARAKDVRQLTTAVADGATAGIAANAYLQKIQ